MTVTTLKETNMTTINSSKLNSLPKIVGLGFDDESFCPINTLDLNRNERNIRCYD